jgi:hypothetical protein
MYAGAVGVVVEVHPAAPNAYAVLDSGGERFAAFTGVLEPDKPLRPDVPRAAVEDLLAAIEKRILQCKAEEALWETDYRLPLASSELAHIATALRQLLGGES